MPTATRFVRQDSFAIGMLAVQAAVFAYLSETYAWPAIVCAGAMAAWSLLPRMSFPRERRFLGGLLLSVGFLVGWIVAPYEPPTARVFLQYSLVHATGQYFLTLQAAQFFVREPQERITLLQPFFGTIVLICAADVYVSRTQLAIFQISVVTFVILAAGFFGAMRSAPAGHVPRRMWGRATVQLAGLCLAAAATWAGCLLLHHFWDDLERLFDPQRRQAPYSTVGFSRQARLGSIEHRKTHQEEATALRVYSAAMPGYLRGAAYDVYHDSQWTGGGIARGVAALEMKPPLVPPELADLPAFVLRRTPSTSWTALEVWKDPLVAADAVFAPLGTSVLDAAADAMVADEHDIATVTGMSSNQNVIAYVPAQRQEATLEPEARRRLTWLPPSLRSHVWLRPLAERVFAGCRTPREKIAAVEHWFRDRYEYRLGISPPSGEDPVAWFLLHAPAAHCEYFASGAAILLRLGDVPCRYVTGFVTAEFNPAGGYWLARNKDAHAWVEAYSPREGWVTVEATPSDGVPSPSTQLEAGHFFDDLWLRILRIRASFARSGWRGLLTFLWGLAAVLVTTTPGRILSIAVFGWVSWRMLRSMRWSWRLRAASGAAGQLGRLLTVMDGRLRKLAIHRQPFETLHQFAGRLRAASAARPELGPAADWYLTYADARYRGAPTPETIQSLTELLRRRPGSRT